MNKEAFYHHYESNYSFPISLHQLKVRVRTQKNDSITSITCLWNISYFFQKERKETVLQYRCSDDLFDYYEAVLESKIAEFAYVFRIECDEGTYFYSEEGFMKALDISECEISSFRLAYVNKADLIEENPRFAGNVFYQIFPERFNMGDLNKDTSYINTPWDAQGLKNRSPSAFIVFMGGDLKGVEAKLDYLSDLGVNTIYLTPIHPSISNHKYDIMDYFGIDAMFGGEKAFHDLVQAVHQKKMNIVLDMVFNHTSKLHPFFLDVKEKGKDSPYFEFYMVEGDRVSESPLNYLSFHGGSYMPKLNTSNQKVQEYLIEVGKYYLNKYHVDGYRLDVANEVSHDFWISFKKELKKIDPNILIIGEVWHDSLSYLHAFEFDGVMNYPFLVACQQFFVSHRLNAEGFVNRLNNLLMRYTDNSNKMMLNLLDSHDMPRFIHMLDGNKRIFLLAFLALIVYQGMPMLYYGDEIFMMGGRDPDNRRGMEWNSKEFSSQEHLLFKKIVALRNLDAIRLGDIRIYEKDSLVFIERIYKNQKILSIINNSDKVVDFKNEKKIILAFNYANQQFQPYSFLVVQEH